MAVVHVGFSCDYCNFSCGRNDSKLFFNHLIKFHSNEPNFQVYCGSCPRSFAKVNSLQKHFYREHINVFEDTCTLEIDRDLNENVDHHPGQAQEPANLTEETVHNNLKLHTAKFLLCAKEEGKLTGTALNMVKVSTRNLLREYMDIVKTALAAKIKTEIEEEFEFSNDMEALFDVDQIYDGLNSEHHLRSYYLNNFNLMEPEQVKLGDSWKYVASQDGTELKRVSSYGYRVSLFKSLEALLQNPDVLREVENPHFSDDNILRDVMDGDFFQSHPVFSVSKDALQLLGYYDDLEIANPLGSKSKIHKIGVFYYVLGNIQPIYRSTIRTIQLLCIAKTVDIKTYGVEKLLLPFTQEVNSLTKDNGHCFTINGQARNFRGGLLLWTGDTLANNYLGGFKEGVGGALRFCRHCMATRQEANEKFRSEEFLERNLESHLRICQMIEDVDNNLATRNALSTTYGINRRSILANVEHFDICQCFPEDIMHILFEGVVPYETKLLMKMLIDERRFFTLKQLNRKIDSFEYGYMNMKSKPSPITRETLNALGDAKLKQSASQMWCLFRFLPIIIGDLVDDELLQWHCFSKLWNIVQMCTSPAIRKDDIPFLKLLIDEHHSLFKQLYPEASIIPKMHYLTHIPDDIIRFGPARNLWTMRFEAKHTFFKGSLSKNFKNVCKTLAFRHQRTMCWHLLMTPGQTITNYLYKGDVVGSGKHDVDLKQHPLVQMLCVAAGLTDVPGIFIGSSVKRVSIHGIDYRPGCVLRLQEMEEFGESDYPVYGLLEEIIVWEHEKFFVVTVCQTLAFCSKYISYEIFTTEQKAVVLLRDLPWHGVLNIIKKSGKRFVVEKDTCSVEDTYMPLAPLPL